MPYLFPQETLFLMLMGLLIVGLLILRWTLVRRRNQLAKGEPPPHKQ